MKKIIALFLSLIMTFGFCVTALAADKCSCGKTPVIMISGFGATTLVRVNDDGTQEVVFPPSTDRLLDVIKKNADKLDVNDISKFIYAIIEDILDPIRMNPDGTSYYYIKAVYSSVEDTCYDGFVRNNATAYIPYGDSDFLDMKSAAERLGGDHVFNFLFDWRKSGNEVADELLRYIEEVRSLTGHDKVSVYCLSQGSVPVAQYLYKYAQMGYIENMVFDNPIFDGSEFVSEILCGEKEMNLNIDEVLDLLESILHTEINVSEILGVLPGDKIDPFVNTQVKLAAEKVIFPVAKDAPAYLEMAPSYEFERIVKTYFSGEGNEKLVAEASKVMNGYRSDIEGTLRNAMNFGAEISIISCSGFGLVTGGTVQSDAIVNLSSSCGAHCNKIGEPFDASYVQKKNIGKYCISPDRTIDLSCGYLPERTWIINERYHGQGEWAPNSLALIEELLYTHNLKDAWCSAQFPQFMQSDDPCSDIFASFRETNSLLTQKGGSGELVIRNTSDKFTSLITEVTCDGAELSSSFCPTILAPGDEMTLLVDTSECSYGSIDVKYYTTDNLITEKTKCFGFTVTDEYGGVVTEKENSDEMSFLETILSTLNRLITRLIEILKNLIG